MPDAVDVQDEGSRNEERDDVDCVQDERVGERLGLGDVVGTQRDDGRRLEDPEPGRARGQGEREPRRDHHEEAGAGR